MQDKIILGLLQFRDMTSYDVKKAIENSTAFFYNASMGSIHPALKKLETSGSLTSTSVVENGRAKKIYSITDQGRKVFANWLSEGLPLEKFKDETLVRLFFFGNIEPNEQARHIKAHIESLDEQVAMLDALKAQVHTIEIPEDLKAHAHFQIATLDYGLNYCRFSRDWYQNFLDEQITNHKDP